MIKTQFNPDYNGSNGKEMDPVSLTQPDQTLTIRDLLDRHSKGLALGVNNNRGEYFDTEVPRFQDLTDMLEYKQQLMERKKDLEKQIRKEKAKQKKEEKEARAEGETVLGDSATTTAIPEKEIISGTE